MAHIEDKKHRHKYSTYKATKTDFHKLPNELQEKIITDLIEFGENPARLSGFGCKPINAWRCEYEKNQFIYAFVSPGLGKPTVSPISLVDGKLTRLGDAEFIEKAFKADLFDSWGSIPVFDTTNFYTAIHSLIDATRG